MSDSITGGRLASDTVAALVGIFVVCAHRWGLRDAHSYVVGAYLSKDDAQRVANEHVAYRGGKYGCEVVLCGGPASEEGNAHEQVHYAETPYYGAAGRGSPSCEPADRKKPLWEDDANLTNGLQPTKESGNG